MTTLRFSFKMLQAARPATGFFKWPQACKHATASIILLSTALAQPALAGFEWVPPAQVQTAPAPAPQAAPAMSQFSDPAAKPYGAASPFPTPQASPYAGAEQFANPIAPMAPPAANAGQLVINPYPLTQGGYGDVLMGMGPVEQAMMAESRALNPLPLGGGLNTGAKTRAMAPTYPQGQAPAAAPMDLMAGGMGAMSPMPGGNPSPLPGFGGAPAPVEQASLAPMPMAAPVPTPAPVQKPVMDRTPRAPDVAMKAAPKIKQPPIQRPVTEASVPAVAATGSQSYSEAVGFGNDLPLALALSQVIPEDYALFFETKVDAEQTNVSWQGGKPWNEVLQEMLAPLGLRADIQPNLVMIRGA